MTSFAPIAYFAFNRPQHTARTLAALSANPEAASTDLHVFVDGTRDARDQAAVDEVLRIARTISGFRSVTVHASASNQGLYRSITRGVSQIVAQAGKVIVVEDDILTTPYFLSYMNDGLETYREVAAVGCIHAYSPATPGFPDFFFLRGGDCWGWATWADRWQLYREQTRDMIEEVVAGRQLKAFLDINGHHSLAHLIKRARGKNQSWAANWHASLFLAHRLTLHPGQSFVENIGNDGTGTHAAVSDVYSTTTTTSYTGIGQPEPVHDHKSAHLMRDFLDDIAHETLFRRLRRKLITAWLVAQALAIYASQRMRRI